VGYLRNHPDDQNPERGPDPALTRFLLNDRRLAWIWVCARAYLACVWALSGVSLLQEVVRFSTDDRMIALADPLPADFVQFYPSILILLGMSEMVVGVLLLLGIFTGLTAFISVVLSVNTLYPGPPFTDPLAFVTTILLVLTWRTAGWYGLDRWLLKSPATAPTPSRGATAKGKR
jgi:thiosulfate dehydrogenase [quinone] large subunit